MTYNKLTEAEAERLAMLAEEAGEIVQAVTKILRHGYGSYHPNDPALDNRALLSMEVADLMAVVLKMANDFNPLYFEEEYLERIVKEKEKWMHHQ